MQETQETQAQSPGREDPLEESMATHSVFLPGQSHGQRRLEGYSPWSGKEPDVTEHACMQGEGAAQKTDLAEGFQGGGFKGNILGEGFSS